MQRTILGFSISCISLLFASAAPTGCGGSSCEDTATCNVGDGGDTSSGTGVGGSATGTGGSGAGAGGSGTGTATGTGSGTGSGTGTGSGMQPDNTPPSVQMTMPSDGATGIQVGQPLVISFTEDMNKADTEGAFSSPDMGNLTFAWPDDRTLEVSGDDVSYAAGTVSVSANVYEWTLSTGAKDLAGNALQQERTGSFSTLREITTDPPMVLQTSVNSSGSTANCVVPGGGKFIGDRSSTRCRVLIDYDLSGIPTASDVTDASLGCSRESVTGTPFSNFGPVSLHHVDYDPSDLEAGFVAAPIGQSGTAFSSASQSTMNVAVTSALATQVAANAPTLQLRLDFNQSSMTVTLADQYVFFHTPSQLPSHGCESGSLSVTYLTP